jgi:hypothetical protein
VHQDQTSHFATPYIWEEIQLPGFAKDLGGLTDQLTELALPYNAGRNRWEDIARSQKLDYQKVM